MLNLKRLPARENEPTDGSLLVFVMPDGVPPGTEVRLYLVRTTGREVKLAVDAPRAVQIERGEVYRRKRNADPHRADPDRDWEAWAKNHKGGPQP
jgi:sRNA-binding carbon storage regulator CsrA